MQEYIETALALFITVVSISGDYMLPTVGWSCWYGVGVKGGAGRWSTGGVDEWRGRLRGGGG